MTKGLGELSPPARKLRLCRTVLVDNGLVYEFHSDVGGCPGCNIINKSVNLLKTTDQQAAYIAVKDTTCNDARPKINT